MPPKEIAEIVDAPPEPLLSFSPDRTLVLQLGRPPSNPPISELARPELKLAGADVSLCSSLHNAVSSCSAVLGMRKPACQHEAPPG